MRPRTTGVALAASALLSVTLSLTGCDAVSEKAA